MLYLKRSLLYSFCFIKYTLIYIIKFYVVVCLFVFLNVMTTQVFFPKWRKYKIIILKVFLVKILILGKLLRIVWFMYVHSLH